MVEKKHTAEDLKEMQSRSFGDKVQTSIAKIIEAMNLYEGAMYVSFSGGKDSTVLADLVAKVCKTLDCKLTLWFSDTGLEFPELREHVKNYGEYLKQKYDIDVETVIDCPKDKNGERITFRDVILNEGYPVISKTVSRQIHDVKTIGNNCWAARCFDGRETGQYRMTKWKFLLDAPFKISNKCCNIMKKKPAHQFNKKSGLIPFIGTMASESIQRKNSWLKSGCNAFNDKTPSSRPISFWTDQDVLKYIVRYKLPYPSVYGEILKNKNGKYYTTGYDRTGCMFCAYGSHLEKEPNRFQRLKITHPKVWEFCMKPIKEGGLGMRFVLEYIGVKYE